MTAITRERLLKIQSWRETYGPGSNIVMPAEEAEELARIALASMDAKPIGQVVEIGPVFIADFYGQVTRGDKLYAAPPAPVGLINDAYLESIIKEQEANLKAAEYELKKNAPQPTPESADRKMLKRLAVIMSGNDAPGEIRSLTVTAQSLVDRCKTLAREKENSHLQWKPASPDEINKRSVRESTDTDFPSREAIIAGGVLVQCPRCHGDSYYLKKGGNHYWCDKCANAITSEGK